MLGIPGQHVYQSVTCMEHDTHLEHTFRPQISFQTWRWLLQEYCPETLASRSITTMTGRPVTSVAGAREAARRVEAGGIAVAHLEKYMQHQQIYIVKKIQHVQASSSGWHLGSLFALVDIITLLLVSFPIP